MAYYKDPSISHLDMGNDEAISELTDQTLALVEGTAQVLIWTLQPELHFANLRAKYLLLPLPSYTFTGNAKSFPVGKTNYILAIRQQYLAQGQRPRSAQAIVKEIEERHAVQVLTIIDLEAGVLLKILDQNQLVLIDGSTL
ncbi:MAG: hypothetical protein ACJAYC_000229 [Halieaceae bacterium]|jgi:hypothetical protein